MGELAEDFAYMKEQKRKERERLQPQRLEYSFKLLKEQGYHVTKVDETELLVEDFIKFFPFTGWWSGKGVGSGRGIQHLIKALNKKA